MKDPFLSVGGLSFYFMSFFIFFLIFVTDLSYFLVAGADFMAFAFCQHQLLYALLYILSEICTYLHDFQRITTRYHQVF